MAKPKRHPTNQDRSVRAIVKKRGIEWGMKNHPEVVKFLIAKKLL